MSTMEYRGYNGTVQYSAKDHLLYGSVLGIRDTITYDGDDVSALERNFASAVDEYLAFCETEHKTPDAPYKGSFNVRLSPELHKRAALYANEHGKKLNNVVVEALEEHLTHT